METPALSFADAIRLLRLAPHPEGGHYVETFRDQHQQGDAQLRGHSTAIYFALSSGQRSHWHRVDASEVFHHYLGVAVELSVWMPGQPVRTQLLGPDLARGERPQLVVEAGAWQAARALSPRAGYDYCLLGCTVAPAFEFNGFELAPPDFEPAL